jgi:AcrR family transcriptional regulator
MENSVPKRGRPRDPERLKRVLEAAAQQFLEDGLERASVEAIAKASGVSKVTIYSYFPTKESLFEAAVASCTEEVFSSIPHGALDPRDPENALMLIGKAFLQLKRSDMAVGTFRLMFSVSGQHAESCEAFYRQGPKELIHQVADYLRAATSTGSLSIRNADEAADQFLSLFLGSADIRVMLGLGKPKASEDARLIKANVDLFLRAYAK